MTQAAWGGLDDSVVPTRYVFDEGHHVFDAADSAFSAELSGLETAELRRWLLGAEGGRSRARGLKRRIEELVAAPPDAGAPLDAALQAARALPAPGWSSRALASERPELGGPESRPAEPDRGVPAAGPPPGAGPHGGGADGDRACAARWNATCSRSAPAWPRPRIGWRRALARIAEPLATLRERLLARLDEEADDMDAATRNRIEAAGRSLNRRALDPLSAWQSMLRAADRAAARAGHAARTTSLFLRARRARDGARRHRCRAAPPLARPDHPVRRHPGRAGAGPAGHLRDAARFRRRRSGNRLGSGRGTRRRAASALAGDPRRRRQPVRLRRADPRLRRHRCRHAATSPQLAAAYRALFMASGGGALGLFTAIRRLQAVHARIAPELEAAGIPLYAQHVDAMGNATLVDIFRTEEESCLLGTDAMRDGVDVPGRALRLVVFEKVPWPRPDILHRERRIHLSDGDPKAYDDRIARLRLRQAFGRLIRRATDRGVFVLLDRQTPSRLLSAFPAGVVVRRVGLAEAVRQTRAFLDVPLPA